jgi:hypothetical protein
MTNKFFLLNLYVLGLNLTILVLPTPAWPSPPAGEGIRPYTGNPMYWQYNGKPTLLLGGMAYGEPHLTPKDELVRELDKLKASGGNYMRDTMAVFVKTPVQGVYPFVKHSDGKYDLSKHNPTFWNHVKVFYEETQKRGMIAQVELWDQWEQYKDNWDKNPWNPKNNINYTSSATGIPEVQNNAPYSKTPPFFYAYKDSNKKVVLKLQRAYIKKLLDVGRHFNNIIYEIGNESSEPQAWNDYWANFIKSNSDKMTSVTDQRGDYNPDGDLMYVINHSNIYDFIDVSQIGMGHTTNDFHQKHYNDFINIRNKILTTGKKCPVNNTKGYKWIRSWGDEYAGGESISINRLWHGIFAGLAGFGFHPSHYEVDSRSGSAMLPNVLRNIKGVRWMESQINMTKMNPDNDVLLNRSSNEAYAMSEFGGKTHVVFFTGENGKSVDIDLKLFGGKTFKLTWYNPNANTIHSTKIINGGGHYSLTTPYSGRWLAILK